MGRRSDFLKLVGMQIKTVLHIVSKESDSDLTGMFKTDKISLVYHTN